MKKWMVASGWVHVDSLSHREASLDECSTETWFIPLVTEWKSGSGVRPGAVEVTGHHGVHSLHITQRNWGCVTHGWCFDHSSSPAACLRWAVLLPPAPFPCFLSPWANVTSLWFCNICLDLCQTGFLVSGRDFRSTGRLSCCSSVCCAFWKFRFQKPPLYILGLIAPSWWTDGDSVRMKLQKNNFALQVSCCSRC